MAPPRCYRHPNRETRIACTRCSRPICPECMVPAPVGFHCPACVDQARRAVPAVRSPLGGVARAQPHRATAALIGANVVLYLATVVTDDRLVLDYGMFGAAVAAGEWWRVVTAPFLHAGLWHLGLNMFALWILGGVLEPLLGRWRFVSVYLISAVAGAVASYAFGSPLVVSVGASGAVFGLLGAILVSLRRLNRDVSGVVVLLVINLGIGFVVPNIDWRAHLGGLLAGVVATAAMLAVPRRYAVVGAWGALAAVLTAVTAIAAWRTDQLLSILG